jgi:Ca-activated chloride channel family protein
MTANRDKLLAATHSIFPEDDTRVRDATLEGINAITARLDPDAINAVVVLTDGEDTTSSHSASDVIAALDRQRSKESGQIRVFTIAYGADPNASELEQYAQASGGKSYKGGADDIGSIYRSISSFF